MRESPRFFGQHFGMTAQEVYDKWVELGLIEEYRDHQVHGWKFTDYGKSLGGRYSAQGGTPTFEFEDIKHLMGIEPKW